jgi:hypothetical protein
MDNLSTDIGSRIGALELDNHLESHSDGVLEASVQGPPPPTVACGTYSVACMPR